MAVRFTGLPEGVVNWSVDEDATSMDRSDSPSGVPQVSVVGVGSDTSVLGMQRETKNVISSDYGRVSMELTDAEVTEGSWSVSGGSPLTKLNHIGTVASKSRVRADQAVRAFFAAVGVSPSGYKLVVSSGLSDRLFDVPYWHDNVWVGFRQWLSANELDIAWIIDTLYVTPMRSSTLYLQDLSSSYSMTLDSSQIAKTIKVNVYHREHFSRALVYPARQSKYPNAELTFGDTEYSTISVDAGEVATAEVNLGGEVESLRTPQMVTAIPVKDSKANIDVSVYPNGLYMVVGKDNKRIMPAQWADMGGGLSVKLNPDHKTATITVSGMNYEPLSPYRICESDGENDYPGLFLVGTNGELVDIETLSFDTGVGESSDSDVTIDNTSIVNAEMAYRAAQAAADVNTGHTLTLSWSGPDPVRSSFGGEVRQSFGRIAGTRFFLRGHWWRASGVTISDSGVSLDADRDTKLEDIMRMYSSPRDLTPAGRTLGELSDVGVL